MTIDEAIKYLDENSISKQFMEWLIQLKKYQELEKQDKLIYLPCKVGDTVWEYESFGLREYKVTNMGFDKNWKLYFDCDCGVAYSIRCYIEDFGTTVFFSKEEALQMLTTELSEKDIEI